MKTILHIALIAITAILITACAPPKRGGPGAEFGARRAVGINRPSSLLAAAREQQATQSCAKAAPAYRMVASYGEGYEIAQYELGACLLEMTGANDAETALFRQEGVFWLSRAAWAGDPRAQGKLAEALSGAPGFAASHIAPDPEAALMWSIIYMSNGARDTYALRPVPSPVSDHLKNVISEAASESANAKAERFARVKMEAFVAPPMAQNAGGPQGGPQGRGRPPRRQIETARP
ncbi:hypothetical protein [Hyphococcus sp.]|uniref:hypothetical protein n=1 Tax=Hyphococcus sp. TaxID=2038636 RepID=UPI0035C7429B